MELDRQQAWNSTLVKNHDENKTYILVKLSESFSNAIQEYSAAQLLAPTIKFHGTRGAIKFPNGKSYDFSLEQPDYSVECIKQVKNRWESVGKMTCCLHVKGKDDVYQRTRTKMEAAEQEKRKFCTKLLGSPEHNNGYSSTSTTTNTTTTTNTNTATATTTATTTVTVTATATATATTTAIATAPATAPTPAQAPVLALAQTQAPASIPAPNTVPKQMRRYKADFERDFKEYQSLHNYLHQIEERFKNLRELLRRSSEGSPEWESAKQQIFSEYERVKGDSNFHRARNTYKQLHKKLAHIKDKIFRYKQQQKQKQKNDTVGHKRIKKS